MKRNKTSKETELREAHSSTSQTAFIQLLSTAYSLYLNTGVNTNVLLYCQNIRIKETGHEGLSLLMPSNIDNDYYKHRSLSIRAWRETWNIAENYIQMTMSWKAAKDLQTFTDTLAIVDPLLAKEQL